MSTVEFIAGQPSVVYYVGVFSDGNFYDSNYFQQNVHNKDTINYNIGDYMLLIYYDGINYYLANILSANTDMSTSGPIKVNMTYGGKIEQVVDFSSITNNTLIVTRTKTNINNYITQVDRVSGCDYYIFGDMSNSIIGTHNNLYIPGHNICVNPSLYDYIQNLLNPEMTPPKPPLAPIPSQNKPLAPAIPSPSPAPATPTNDSSSTATTAIIIIAVLIILALIIFGGLYFYKKNKSHKISQ